MLLQLAAQYIGQLTDIGLRRAPRHDEDLPRAQADGSLAAAVAQRDVEHAVEHQEEFVGVLVHVPDVLTPGMRS
jgi:hypothetical protein